MYSQWFVLFVTSGKENFIKRTILENAAEPITLKIFQREIIHRHKGRKRKVANPLFPGYIFVHKDINTAYRIAKQHLSGSYVYPVCFDGKPGQVEEQEMEILLRNANKSGMFKLSSGYKVGDQIQIVEGPLKKLKGNILWIDEKKCKARVELFLFQRKMKINLGIEFVQHSAV